MADDTTPRPPNVALWASEGLRTSVDIAGLAGTWPALAAAPRGDGHPVLVLPGLATSDMSTVTLRALLRGVGYTSYGWKLGRNIGPTRKITDGMRTRLDEIADKYGRPVSLIGWSLGGIFARRIARERPDLVRQVITLGSPFKLEAPVQSRAHGVYNRFKHLHVEDLPYPLEAGLGPMPMPATSVYSRLDGIVHWRACLDEPSEFAENIEVRCAHLGFGHHLPTLWIIADRLAQQPGRWQPFRRPSWMGLAVPRVEGGVPAGLAMPDRPCSA